MTLVNTVTGEVLDLDRGAAERRAERITLRLDAIADNYRAVLPMIREAIEKRDDLALGYRSPGDYVSDRFGQSLAGLGIEVRRAVVGELTEAGLSTRAIAPVVGVSQKTVDRDARQVSHLTHLPQSSSSASPVADEDKTPAAPAAGDAPAMPEPTPQAAPDEDESGAAASPAESEDSTAATPAAEKPAIARPPVVGIDGKTYIRPNAGRTQRRSRDDAEVYLNAVEMHARKAAREADKLTAAQIARVRAEADLWTVGLRESVETLQRLLTSLTKEK